MAELFGQFTTMWFAKIVLDASRQEQRSFDDVAFALGLLITPFDRLFPGPETGQRAVQ